MASRARATDRDSSPPYGLWQLVLAKPAVHGDAGADHGPTSGPRQGTAPRQASAALRAADSTRSW
jgi:hypothetical protein